MSFTSYLTNHLKRLRYAVSPKETRTNSYVKLPCRLPHKYTQVLSNKQMLYTQLCLYEPRGTCIYKNTSLILFSKGAHSLLLVWDIDGETYTQRGDFFLSHILFREPGSANACTPLQSVSSETSETPLIGCLSLAWLRFSGHCLNMTAWFSYSVVSFRLHTCSNDLPRRTAIPLFTNHHVTACQSKQGH